MSSGRNVCETAAVNLLICLIVVVVVALLLIGPLLWRRYPENGSAQERKDWLVGFAVTAGLLAMVGTGVVFCLFDQFGRMLF